MSTTPVSHGTIGKFGLQWSLPAGDAVAIEDHSLTEDAEELEFPGELGAPAGLTYYNFKTEGDISITLKSTSTKVYRVGDVITLTCTTSPTDTLKLIVRSVGKTANWKDWQKTTLSVKGLASLTLS